MRNPLLGNRFKISGHNTTFWLTRGFFTALLGSAFLYLSWLGLSHPLPNTILALSALCLLLSGDRKVWLASGFFIGIFWFWWMTMSFRFYGFPWAIPIGILLIALIYGGLFWGAAALSEWIEKHIGLSSLWPKSLFLLAASLIHPFGFDWFKPELIFVESYFGIEKWHFAIVLIALVLVISRRKLPYILLSAFAFQPLSAPPETAADLKDIKLVTTYIPVEKKWDPRMLTMQIDLVMDTIDDAIENGKKLIIFPESVLPLFLNKKEALLAKLETKSQHISIVLGALKWDDGIPRNSTYIFQKGQVQIIDKVVLVPFGEKNPLPDWLGRIVNRIFYDGAVDYQASGTVTDYKLDGRQYRNAICYEACSEELYRDAAGEMIVLSNNGWFVPSIEPTEQRLLLQYYSRKYGTTIYHSINMSPSYIIEAGQVVWEEKSSPEEAD